MPKKIGVFHKFQIRKKNSLNHRIKKNPSELFVTWAIFNSFFKKKRLKLRPNENIKRADIFSDF